MPPPWSPTNRSARAIRAASSVRGRAAAFAFSSAIAAATTSADDDDSPDATGTSPTAAPSMPRRSATPCSSSPFAAART